MNITDLDIALTMIRDNLDDIPRYDWPAGYRLRWFGPGDEALWVRIQAAADRYNEITPTLFRAQFGQDAKLLSRRMAFILDPQGRPTGNASAWFTTFQGRRFGQVHWVAILPETQGQGLALPLMSAVLDRLQSLGHDNAYLTTSTARPPAVNLYLKFGFRPVICDRTGRDVWRKLSLHLKYPLEIGRPA